MQISFRLTDNSSIDNALKQLAEYKKKVDSAPAKLTKSLVDKGVQLAQENVSDMGAIDSWALQSSIHAETNGATGAVVADAGHAAFVEFGTGVVGASDPHPNPGLAGWKYDVNEHGEKGWWYPGKDGKLHWTKGMASRPFMYDTSIQIRDYVEPMAKEAMK